MLHINFMLFKMTFVCRPTPTPSACSVRLPDRRAPPLCTITENPKNFHHSGFFLETLSIEILSGSLLMCLSPGDDWNLKFTARNKPGGGAPGTLGKAGPPVEAMQSPRWQNGPALGSLGHQGEPVPTHAAPPSSPQAPRAGPTCRPPTPSYGGALALHPYSPPNNTQSVPRWPCWTAGTEKKQVVQRQERLSLLPQGLSQSTKCTFWKTHPPLRVRGREAQSQASAWKSPQPGHSPVDTHRCAAPTYGHKTLLHTQHTCTSHTTAHTTHVYTPHHCKQHMCTCHSTTHSTWAHATPKCPSRPARWKQPGFLSSPRPPLDSLLGSSLHPQGPATQHPAPQGSDDDCSGPASMLRAGLQRVTKAEPRHWGRPCCLQPWVEMLAWLAKTPGTPHRQAGPGPDHAIVPSLVGTRP